MKYKDFCVQVHKMFGDVVFETSNKNDGTRFYAKSVNTADEAKFTVICYEDDQVGLIDFDGVLHSVSELKEVLPTLELKIEEKVKALEDLKRRLKKAQPSEDCASLRVLGYELPL